MVQVTVYMLHITFNGFTFLTHCARHPHKNFKSGQFISQVFLKVLVVDLCWDMAFVGLLKR